MSTVRLEISRPHHLGLEPEELLPEVARRLGVRPAAVRALRLQKRALDARRKLPAPAWLLTIDAELEGPLGRHADPSARPAPLEAPRTVPPRAPADAPPVVVVGAGPAGLFAAWQLAEGGARVILVERGKPVETRARDFGLFRGRAILNPESNLCFGEGGAGTYSDGKLTCRRSGPRAREVLERLVEVGAPERILVDAKPHIGTNLLFGVLKTLRRRLLDLGVTVHFETRMERLRVEGGRVVGIDTSSGQLDAPRVVLAMGHSARDTFEVLLAQGVPMEAKPFAVGVRAEHPQALIDRVQYRLRADRPPTLPPADYRLAHTEGDRGVYSFCMCPGGMIVPTATELETVVVNGMSTARRSSPFANSGVVVQVGLADLEREGYGQHALAGVALQRDLERRAFRVGGGTYHAPAMLASDFVKRRASAQLAGSHFRPGLVPADLREVLPPFIAETLAAGMVRFDGLLRGYASSDANLIAVESRTSSPIRIPRDAEGLEVPGFSGLHVAGEGPGYAGGIMSAAMDGLEVASAVLARLSAGS